MNNKFTMELVWHNWETCPPEEDHNFCLVLSDGEGFWIVEYYAQYGWFCDDGTPITKEEFKTLYWADLSQTISKCNKFKEEA